MSACVFCEVVRGERPAAVVYEDEEIFAFLDHRPLLHGHCLVVPRRHIEMLPELPADLLVPFFGAVQRLAGAVEEGLAADGSFVAINTKISQSVPHLHVHVVPRWKKDGLFSYKLLWKRAPYESEAQMRVVAEKIRRALAEGLKKTAGTGARRYDDLRSARPPCRAFSAPSAAARPRAGARCRP